MKENLSLLFKKRVKILYPFVSLSGGRDLGFKNAPFLGLGIVEFQKESVSVSTIDFDDEAEVDITIYDGIPSPNNLPKNTIWISGFIEIGNDGVMVYAGDDKEAILEWTSGLTAILVVLEAEEVTNRTIKSAVFYLKYFRKINHGLNIMGLFSKGN